MQAINSTNPLRYNALLQQVQHEHRLAHLLDRIIYRCQNSIYFRHGTQVFAESLDSLAKFSGYASTRVMLKDLKRLEALGCITRETVSILRGRRCYFGLTQTITALPPKPEKDGIVFCQATNMHRYAVLSKLLAQHGIIDIVTIWVMDSLIYLCQRDTNRVQGNLESHYAPITQTYLAKHCGLSLRTLQRHLGALSKAGLLHKTHRRVSSCLVETCYRVDIALIHALQTVNREQEERETAATNKQYLTQNAIKPYTQSGGSSSTQSGGRNININKCNINKSNKTKKTEQGKIPTAIAVPSTQPVEAPPPTGHVNLKKRGEDKKQDQKAPGLPQPPANVLRETRSDIDQPHPSPPRSRPALVLDSQLDGKTALDPRQLGYIRGMMQTLTREHHCQFSDPIGLLAEIRYAIMSVSQVFVGKSSFVHRVNLVAKLLKQNRWTTPYGYERYDAQGKTQKAKREAREQRSRDEKRRPPSGNDPLCLSMLRGSTAPPYPLASRTPSRQNAIPDAVTERLEAMKKLAKRAESPDCSAQVRQSITELIQQHAAEIKRLQSQPVAPSVVVSHQSPDHYREAVAS